MKIVIGVQLVSMGEQVLEDLRERRDHVEATQTKTEIKPTKPSKPNADVSRSSHNNADRNNGSSDGIQRTIQVTATAYTAFCDTGCTGVTATGLDVSETIRHEGKRIIATDPNVIPLGTDVTLRLADGKHIEAVAADTGGAIDGHRIDLLTGSKQEAINFGRQTVELTLH
jgi:3D (Asp-Asp-Asp) domain-containing protein